MIEVTADDLLEDIYYQREYFDLYDKGGEHFEYLYQEGDKYIKFISLKRRIESVAGNLVNDELYDLETPYGYGGPLSNCWDEGFLKRAFLSYRNHCKKQNIVCEFIRFHPFNRLADSKTLFDIHIPERQVVIVDLLKSSEERRRLYSKTTRNIIKRAAKNLVVNAKDVPVNDFMKMYYSTMQKNAADEFYYFKEEYFKSLMALEEVSLLATLKESEYASIGFFMFSHQLAYYHLSANNQALSKENGNYLLLDAAFDYAKLKGCRYMLLGGGRTSSPEDSLFKFKNKFSPINKTFYIAGLNFLPEKRQQLNQIWINSNPYRQTPRLFQLYRA